MHDLSNVQEMRQQKKRQREARGCNPILECTVKNMSIAIGYIILNSFVSMMT